MELVEGETLEARIRREGPMPLSLALEITEQAARALAAAEACGVVHRDIKPSNIMLESDASGALVVKVIDYGVAKVLAPQAGAVAEQTQAGFIGTPAFASPEQFAENGKSRIDTRSDIYSLGVTLWFLLCGRTPFVGRTLEEIRAKQNKPLPLEQFKGLHIPSSCLALLQSMLAPDPARQAAICPRATLRGSSLLRTIQPGSTLAPPAICPHRSRDAIGSDSNRFRSLALPTRAIFRSNRTLHRDFAF
jgi:serine/threonine protein kinase